MNETLELAMMPFQLAFMQNAFIVTLMIAVLCFNLLGDGLRDILDPRMRT